jgi:cell division septum initiation protein DivIVA
MDAESWVELSIAESEARAKLAKEVDSARARIRAEEDRLRNFKEMLEEREKSLLETTGNFIAKTIAEVRQDIKGVGTGIDGVGHKVEDVQDEVEVMSGDVEELRRIVEKQEKMLADLQFKTQSAPATAQSGQYPGYDIHKINSPYRFCSANSFVTRSTPQPMMMGYGGAPVIISYPPNYAPTYPSPYPPSPHPHGSVPPSPYAPPQSSMNGYASGIHTPMQRTASFVDEEKDRTIRIQQDTIDRLNRTLSSGTVSGTQTPQASDRLHQVESLLVEKELTIRVQKDIIDQLKKTYDSMGHTPRGTLQMLHTCTRDADYDLCRCRNRCRP